MIEIKNATIKVGEQVMCTALSFMAMKGKITCVYSENTSALTALIHSFLGMQPLVSGYVSVDGECITPLSAPIFRKKMAYLPCKFNFETITVSTLFHTLCNRDMLVERGQKAMLIKHWQLLEIDKTCYEQPLYSLAMDVQQRIMLSMTSILNRHIILLHQPTLWQTTETMPLVHAYIHLMKAEDKVILLTTTSEQTTAIADIVINLTSEKK